MITKTCPNCSNIFKVTQLDKEFSHFTKQTQSSDQFNIVKGKVKIELPKGTNVEDMTLEDFEKIIEERSPKKKAPAKKKAKKKK